MSFDTMKKTSKYLRNIQVMVVDNDQNIVDLLIKVLKYFGFSQIFGARDGFQSLRIMHEQDIDLVITDWDLQPMKEDLIANLPPNPIIRSEQWSPAPPSSGASFVRYLRASRYSPNHYIPVIMMTDLGLQNSVQYARDSGVNEILLKPICVESLCARIIHIIDAPRPFITADCYKGPCRRTHDSTQHQPERRKHDIKIFRHTG